MLTGKRIARPDPDQAAATMGSGPHGTVVSKSPHATTFCDMSPALAVLTLTRRMCKAAVRTLNLATTTPPIDRLEQRRHPSDPDGSLKT
jgi:hypothetical protein